MRWFFEQHYKNPSIQRLNLEFKYLSSKPLLYRPPSPFQNLNNWHWIGKLGIFKRENHRRHPVGNNLAKILNEFLFDTCILLLFLAGYFLLGYSSFCFSHRTYTLSDFSFSWIKYRALDKCSMQDGICYARLKYSWATVPSLNIF